MTLKKKIPVAISCFIHVLSFPLVNVELNGFQQIWMLLPGVGGQAGGPAVLEAEHVFVCSGEFRPDSWLCLSTWQKKRKNKKQVHWRPRRRLFRDQLSSPKVLLLIRNPHQPPTPPHPPTHPTPPATKSWWDLSSSLLKTLWPQGRGKTGINNFQSGRD